MSRGSALTNLRDMVAMLASHYFQQQFISFYVPDMTVNWGGLAGVECMPRASMIVSTLKSYMPKSEEASDQCQKMIAELRIIALLNTDSDNAAFIAKKIKAMSAFEYWFEHNDNTRNAPKDTATLAVIINLAANEFFSGISQDAVREAQIIWSSLFKTACSIDRNSKFSKAIHFVEPQVTEEERNKRLKSYAKELRRVITSHCPQEKFYVDAQPFPYPHGTRYIVTTSPLPQMVSKINKESNDTIVDLNDNAETFEIVIDEVYNEAFASYSSLISQAEAIDLFLEHVLQTTRTVTQKLSYSDSLRRFASRDAITKLKLPAYAIECGAKCWIESLDIRLAKGLLPVTFRGDEINDIYIEIDRQIDLKAFPTQGWTVVEAHVKVLLPNTDPATQELSYIRDGHGTKTYSITIGDRKFAVNKNRTYDSQHLKILDSLQDEWGFKGVVPGHEKGKFVQQDLNIQI